MSPKDTISEPSLSESLERARAFVDPLLQAAIERLPDPPARLAEAMRYSLLAPGKRLRPALVLWASQACGGSWESAGPCAAAVEMIHAYSLVHDDLPAMDDDDLRRGRPTCHRQFDEATAILCGDALQPLAFETLASGLPPTIAARACLVLAQAAGGAALVGGQAEDLAAERQAGWGEHEEPAALLERIHARKTGALFLASLHLGGLAAGATAKQLATLEAYGRDFGLAFQIADDLLDAEGSEEMTGKRVGKDVGRGKLTFPALHGIDGSRQRAVRLAEEAAAAAGERGAGGRELALLARWIVRRDH
jgi:geranylgeranyl diphosphate synthase type II